MSRKGEVFGIAWLPRQTFSGTFRCHLCNSLPGKDSDSGISIDFQAKKYFKINITLPTVSGHVKPVRDRKRGE